ncbi:MAG: PorP/SprF family type IX secretion system membrane protein [Bacteroidia bacterium]|nr:PorP/SprF family type IX secretion system membrane protein [Bacteroidia bacterium]
MIIIKQYKNIIISIGILFYMLNVNAQDVHFSQFNETPQLLNPGATGVYNGYIRGIVNYKNQWMAMGNEFNTMAASFDIPMFDYNERKAHLGAGLNFFSDKAGDSKFGLTQVNLCLAGIIPVSKESKFSMGLSIGGAQQKADLNSAVWANQYTGQGFDPTINSGETTTSTAFFYADLGAGIYYEYNNSKSTLDRNENKRFAFGVAYYHLNQPKQKYFSVEEKLYGKLVVNVNGHFDKTGSKISILPSAIYFMQGPNMEITAGCAVRYRIKNGTKITGFYSESGIALGVHYRLNDAIIPQLYYQVKDFSIGISYDLNISSYKQASKLNGGIEVSLKYHILKGALFKRKNML